ncbi:hypothetical protein DFH27DRAFT_543068 [Peziza echinospora]|nr:hypothetical protein DFH27DRAFT_543068 [Peziza echinospora]
MRNKPSSSGRSMMGPHSQVLQQQAPEDCTTLNPGTSSSSSSCSGNSDEAQGSYAGGGARATLKLRQFLTQQQHNLKLTSPPAIFAQGTSIRTNGPFGSSNSKVVSTGPGSSPSPMFLNLATMMVFTIVLSLGVLGVVVWVGCVVHGVRYVRRHYACSGSRSCGKGYSSGGLCMWREKELGPSSGANGGGEKIRIFSRSRARRGLLDGWRGNGHGTTVACQSGRTAVIWPPDEEFPAARERYADHSETDHGSDHDEGIDCGRRRSYDEEEALSDANPNPGLLPAAGTLDVSTTTDSNSYFSAPGAFLRPYLCDEEGSGLPMQMSDLNEDYMRRYGKPASRVFLDGLVGSMKGGTWLRGLMATSFRITTGAGGIGEGNLGLGRRADTFHSYNAYAQQGDSRSHHGSGQIGSGGGKIDSGMWSQGQGSCKSGAGSGGCHGASWVGPGIGPGSCSRRSGAVRSDLVGGDCEKGEVTLAFRRDAVMRRALARAGCSGSGAVGKWGVGLSRREDGQRKVAREVEKPKLENELVGLSDGNRVENTEGESRSGAGDGLVDVVDVAADVAGGAWREGEC